MSNTEMFCSYSVIFWRKIACKDFSAEKNVCIGYYCLQKYAENIFCIFIYAKEKKVICRAKITAWNLCKKYCVWPDNFFFPNMSVWTYIQYAGITEIACKFWRNILHLLPHLVQSHNFAQNPRKKMTVWADVGIFYPDSGIFCN